VAGSEEPRYSESRRPTGPPLWALYESAGWVAYTRDPGVLDAAIVGSSHVATAWVGDQLVGLARAVSDGATICYLQDVLVDPGWRRAGVGRKLVARVLDRYAPLRQKVLLTDDEPAQQRFYESLGFTEIRRYGDGRLRAYVRFDG
jgi:GNAT superfamily N-acetyltransferase